MIQIFGKNKYLFYSWRCCTRYSLTDRLRVSDWYDKSVDVEISGKWLCSCAPDVFHDIFSKPHSLISNFSKAKFSNDKFSKRNFVERRTGWVGDRILRNDNEMTNLLTEMPMLCSFSYDPIISCIYCVSHSSFFFFFSGRVMILSITDSSNRLTQ